MKTVTNMRNVMNNSLQSNPSPKGDSSKTGESQVVRNLNDEQNQQASFSGRPTSPTKLESPANLDLSPTHDESTVGQKLLSNFDVSTIATDLPPSAGNDLENPSLSDDPPRTIPFLEDKSFYGSHRETFVNRDLSGSDFDDPFQALSNYQITTFEDDSALYYDRHVEDIDKVFIQEPEPDDHPYQSDSLHAPETITGFPNTIREKTTKFSANKPIRQNSSSGSVVTHQNV